jgi:hypothetical protein
MTPKHPKLSHASQLSELSSWRKYKRELLELEFTHNGSSLVRSKKDLVNKFVRESFLTYAINNPVARPGSHSYLVDFCFLEILGSHFEDIVEGRYPILLVSMPPRTGKSTMGSLFLSWLLRKDPTISHFVTSYDQSSSKLAASRVKELVNTPCFEGMFSKINLEPFHVLSVAPEGSVCGFGYGGSNEVPGVWLIDDYHKSSEAAVNEDWLDQISVTRSLPNSAIVVLGSRFGDGDIFSYFLEKFGVFDPVLNPKGAVHINLSAIVDNKEEAQSDILGRQIKEQLSMFGDEALSATRRALGETKFSWLYKGCPPTPVDSGFKLCEEVPPLDKVIISVDPAFSADSIDKTGICIAGVTKQRDCLYVLETYEGNWNLKTLGVILSLAAKAYGAEEIVLERSLIGPVAYWVVYLQGLGLDVRVGGQSRQAKSSAIAQMRDSGKVYFSDFDTLSLSRECDDLGLSDILCAVLVSYSQLLPTVA